MDTKPAFIAYAVGAGARDHGCAHGPQAWHDAYANVPPWTLFLDDAAYDTADVTEQIAGLAQELADTTEALCLSAQAFVVIGGDHSAAIGTWSGVSRATGGDLGLIWIDAHLDAHTPDTSPSDAIHGMPVACLLGHGDARLTSLTGHAAAIDPERITLVGARSFEQEEYAHLLSMGVRIVTMDEVTQRGLAAVIADSVSALLQRCSHIGLSIDLDALDPNDVPGVGTPEVDGLRLHELVRALTPLRNCPELVGVEIVEFNPLHDQKQLTVAAIHKLIGAIYGEPD